MFEKEIIIDAKGHLMGRLAAIVAKEILCGQKVVVVRAELLVLSGTLFNRKVEFLEFKNKISNTNPRKGGPYHFKSPSQIFYRAVKGMVPRKTQRGEKALERFKVFEGCPFPYSHRQKICAPKSLRVVRLKFGRKFCVLGDLCREVGWNQGNVVDKLEKKRLERSHEYYKAKVTLKKNIDQFVKSDSNVQNLKKELEAYGFQFDFLN